MLPVHETRGTFFVGYRQHQCRFIVAVDFFPIQHATAVVQPSIGEPDYIEPDVEFLHYYNM